MIRVLIVDDSPTFRQLLRAILESDPDLEVIGEAKNGEEAVALAGQLKPDIVTMDALMPRTDGFEATRRIMSQFPCPIVMVTGASSAAGEKISTRASDDGALMVLDKPSGLPDRDPRAGKLINRLKAMSEVKVVQRRRSQPGSSPAVVTRRFGAKAQKPFRLICLGASTGGPPVIQNVLQALDPQNVPPVLIVQHIASGFAESMAGWLDQTSPLEVKVAGHGEIIRPGRAYMAPSDRHFKIGRNLKILLTDEPPVRGLKPSVDLMFESAAAAFGTSLLAALFTGMGSDGAQGMKAVKQAGGYTLAQDEASSVVYGMPREAVALGVIDEQLSKEKIGDRIARLINQRQRS